MELPVCQVACALGQNEEPGLLFSTELKEDASRSFHYGLPLPTKPPRDVFKNGHEVFFPIAIGQRVVELRTKLAPRMAFDVPGTELSVKFTLKLPLEYIRWPLGYPFRTPISRYVGTKKAFVDFFFAVLQPIDLEEMDQLYLKYSVVFVGQTTVFGRETIIERSDGNWFSV
jgi:hypothetical protein